MIVEPKVRGYICTTAHPEGCRSNVKSQIDYITGKPCFNGPKKVLVIGASTGYGLASRICLSFLGKASTIGIIYDKSASETKTASAGWYNTAAFEEFAGQNDLYAKTINGDAYSAAVKEKAIELIKNDFGKVDMVVYSIAAPKRTMSSGEVYSSVIKTIGREYTNKSVDLRTNKVIEVTVPTATEDEIDSTIKVMGGEDWKDWISQLVQADAIEDNAITVAYSYIGPELTHPMYLDGTIGKAKDHLINTAKDISSEFKNIKAYISINKALVTQSSAAIPVVPLYIAILYKIMKAKNIHEGCIEQAHRLFSEMLFVDKPVLDENGKLRPDDLEMRADVQQEVIDLWGTINNDNLNTLADIDGYWEDFYNMFGFRLSGIDYQKDVDINIPIASIGSSDII